MFDHDAPNVVISSVMFGEEEINIQYMEPRESSRAAYKTKAITVKTLHIEEKVDQLIELLEDIIDEGELLIRNPPQRVRRHGLGSGVDLVERIIEDDVDDLD